MAAQDIHKQLKGLRVDTGRRKGRRDPFATGFEDDSEEESIQRSRSQTKKAAPVVKPKQTSVVSTRDSDDEFLDAPKPTKERRPSPAPPLLAASRVSEGAERRSSIDQKLAQSRSAREARFSAAGNLALLDDSSDDNFLSPTKRANRRPSPAPRKDSSDSWASGHRSSTPRGGRDAPTEASQQQSRVQPPRHTVASAFAGTKYLQDSESSGDEEAVVSRNNSADGNIEDIPELNPYESFNTKHPEVKRVDKRAQPQDGGGMSWRAFSTSRTEKRSAELETLQIQLKQRGKSISFGTHATTDDGKRVPIIAKSPTLFTPGGSGGRGRQQGRGKSPPRRTGDVEPDDGDEVGDGDEDRSGIYDPAQFKTNPFTGEHSILSVVQARA